MIVMSPPKKSKESPKPSQQRGYNVNIYLDPAIGERIESHLDSARPKITKTALISAALLEYFERHPDQK